VRIELGECAFFTIVLDGHPLEGSGQVGHVFQGRYRLFWSSGGPHPGIVQYVVLNPVQARLVARPEN
jgi:hypothetical protein